MSTFIRGTAILMIAVFMSKLLGFVYRIQFMRVAGEEAVGIYMTAYPAFHILPVTRPIGCTDRSSKSDSGIKGKGRNRKAFCGHADRNFHYNFHWRDFHPAIYSFYSVFIGNIVGQCSHFHYTVCRNSYHTDCRSLRIDPRLFSGDSQNRRNSLVPNH